MKLTIQKRLVIFLVLLCGGFANAGQTDDLAVIPQPHEVQKREGVFQITAGTSVYSDLKSGLTADFLTRRLRESTGYPVKAETQWVSSGPVMGAIFLTTKDADASLGAEGYELSVFTNAIILRAPTQAGLFYGVQTLLQLLPPAIFSSNVVSGVNWQVPAVEIRDWPRFKWRGFMLDVSRHFYNKAEVEKVLDTIALYKINTFHWHLVDDQGWRIEIKKYPRLTSVGAWRDGVGFGLASNSTTAYGPDGRYGGFYTQDDIREVVAYAAARHITIVPEIEMPGHSLAALAAYPEYGTGKGPFEIQTKGGVNPGIYSPAKDDAYTFVDNILSEVFELFPSKYVHIGGDEVPGEPWMKDPACQALMKREGLKSPEELESWFIRRIEKYVNSKGKTLIGWSEIARGGLAKNAVVMDWIGGGQEAASQGHDVVMTPTSDCYFDYYQSRNHSTEPRAIGGFLPLSTVYKFDPIPAKLDPKYASYILGAQGNLWTEYIPNLKHVEYMMFPRLTALAEVTWSAKSARNYDDFLRRFEVDKQRLQELGVNYRNPALGDGEMDRGKQIGEWKPEQIKTNYSDINWDVTQWVTKPGQINVYFGYTDGDDGIDIKAIELLADGIEVARDEHQGFAGSDPKNSTYTFEIPELKPGVQCTLRAQIAGSGGADSAGKVWWKYMSSAHQ